MRQLYPQHREDVDIAAVYDVERPTPPQRPYVLVNMISSADGATRVSGVTRSLGSSGDRRLFLYLRTLPDVILVGAETVRAEGYGPARIPAEAQEGRRRRGLDPAPRIAVVSRSLDLDWSSAFFVGGPRPIVLAPAEADPARLAAAREAADVVITPGASVDFADALTQLHEQGSATVLCEGGPAINAQLLAAGAIDELCLTVSPHLVGAGGGTTIMGKAGLSELVPLALTSLLEEDGFLFLRYLVGPPATPITGP